VQDTADRTTYNVGMRIAAILTLLFSGLVQAQGFDPKMPAGVPEISGKVVEQATLRYIDIKPGTGVAAAAGQQYTVHYTGWLRDGTQFDSSAGKDPLQFVQGRREVIPGFDVGFEGMKVGGLRRILIPYQLAYGEQGRGKIPPKAGLIFDVELVDVKDAPSQPAAGAELALALEGQRNKVLALAKAIPEEKFGWRPAPGVRSFKEVFWHIALGNRLMLNVAGGAQMDALKKQIAENAQAEQQEISKDKLIEMLSDSFAAVRKALDSERPATLNRAVDFFGTATTRRGVLTFIDTHIAEHTGQLIAYARMNGIAPPWSR
jgi:uncharacterized damage-inducible protein DinB